MPLFLDLMVIIKCCYFWSLRVLDCKGGMWFVHSFHHTFVNRKSMDTTKSHNIFTKPCFEWCWVQV